MVKQYPHTAIIKTPGGTTQDENGDWVQTDAVELYNGECRAEPNGEGKVLKGKDGEEITFQWTVYIPLMSVAISRNSEIELIIDGIKTKELVKRHSNGQLNSRVWV